MPEVLLVRRTTRERWRACGDAIRAAVPASRPDLREDGRITAPHQRPPIRNPLPDVRTARLDLRRFDGGDLDELAAVFAHVEVWKYPHGRAFTRAETKAFLDGQLQAWDEDGFGLWVARHADEGRMLGYVGLAVPTFLPEILPAVEVGWRFAPSAWGQGYATEGAAAALTEAFDTVGFEQVCSVPQATNPRSARVAERLGMKLVRPVTIPANDERGEVIALLYEITSEEWRDRVRRS